VQYITSHSTNVGAFSFVGTTLGQILLPRAFWVQVLHKFAIFELSQRYHGEKRS
jgi:hypothetical protein